MASRTSRKPEVWCLFPSASPENAARTVPAWRDMGYRVAILEDKTRIPLEAPEGCDAKVSRKTYPGWAASINILYREAVPESCPVVVAAGDDMLPDPAHDAQQLALQFIERFADTLGVMQPTGDGFEHTDQICGSPWIGRAWMRRMYAAQRSGPGGLCEAYHQQFADEELYWVARCAGLLWLRPDLTQPHEHFRRQGKPAPAYWVESAAAHEAKDCMTFVARAAAGFPGAAPEGMLDTSAFDHEYSGRAQQRLAQLLTSGDQHATASDKLADAFAQLAESGIESAAVFGAGQHTRRCAGALASPPLKINCIIDQDPVRIGSQIWNYPIIAIDEAVALVRSGKIQAVVLSSDAMEDRLAEAAAPLANAGARIVRLYNRRPSKPSSAA